MIAPIRLALVAAAIGMAPAASARSVATTRLDRCGGGTCLIVTGHRSDASSSVLLAGHSVAVEGGRNWRASVPLDAVRAWSTPDARTIAVRVEGTSGGEHVALLPIGLLGHRTELAFMDVQAR